MKYLPYERYTISTSLSIGEVRKRLLENVEPRRNAQWPFRKATKPYMGLIGPDDFDISRAIGYRNSFLPVIKGRFTTDAGSSTIHIVMRLHMFTLVFMSFWMGIVFAVCVALLLMMIVHGFKGFSVPMLIPFGMLVFGYGMAILAFKGESRIARQFLAELWG